MTNARRALIMWCLNTALSQVMILMLWWVEQPPVAPVALLSAILLALALAAAFVQLRTAR